jgi:hypothetical protein
LLRTLTSWPCNVHYVCLFWHLVLNLHCCRRHELNFLMLVMLSARSAVSSAYLEKIRNSNQEAFITFIDYSKAFDSVIHHHLFETILQMGFPRHLVSLIAVTVSYLLYHYLKNKQHVCSASVRLVACLTVRKSLLYFLSHSV